MTDKKKKRWVTHFEGNCSQEQKKKCGTSLQDDFVENHLYRCVALRTYFNSRKQAKPTFFFCVCAHVCVYCLLNTALPFRLTALNEAFVLLSCAVPVALFF